MLERLLADPHVRVCALVTTVSVVHDRVSIHGVRRAVGRAGSDGAAARNEARVGWVRLP